MTKTEKISAGGGCEFNDCIADTVSAGGYNNFKKCAIGTVSAGGSHFIDCTINTVNSARATYQGCVILSAPGATQQIEALKAQVAEYEAQATKNESLINALTAENERLLALFRDAQGRIEKMRALLG